MDRCELDSKVKRLRELRRMAAELQTEIDRIQDSIKETMECQDTDTLIGENWKITWKASRNRRMDVKAFKAAYPQLYDRFCITTMRRYFRLT